MRLILRYTFLTIFCGLFLMHGITFGQEKPIQQIPNKTNTIVKPIPAASGDKELKVEFPEIDGWVKGNVTTYPRAELGYSVNYESEEAGRVTVYVYNGGMKKISSDVADKAVVSQIEQAKSDIQQYGRMGYYENVKEIKSETVTLGGANGKVKTLYSLFSFGIKGEPFASEIYLFGYQNHFIKIRATRLKAETENKAMTDLLAKIDGLFSK